MKACDVCGHIDDNRTEGDMCVLCETGVYSEKIIAGKFITRLDIQADTVLREAIGNLESVVIAGYDKDGNFYAASSKADGGDVLWLLELCKQRLFECVDTKE